MINLRVQSLLLLIPFTFLQLIISNSSDVMPSGNKITKPPVERPMHEYEFRPAAQFPNPQPQPVRCLIVAARVATTMASEAAESSCACEEVAEREARQQCPCVVLLLIPLVYCTNNTGGHGDGPRHCQPAAQPPDLIAYLVPCTT